MWTYNRSENSRYAWVTLCDQLTPTDTHTLRAAAWFEEKDDYIDANDDNTNIIA
jgi:hypothetical protein